MYSLRTSDGQVRWRTKADGAVKGALALADGKLFFGDYGGKVHAIRQADGGKVWEKGSGGGVLGIGGGNFYSSAAVAYGRVYIGSTSGAVFSFSAKNGALAWRHSTGGYVYASPAVGPGPGGRPTVFIGSYDGRFYALDAKSGKTRWTRHLGRKISGSASLIGDLVFVSDLGRSRRGRWARGRARRSGRRAAARSTRRSPTGGASTSTATRPSSRSTPRDPLRPAEEEGAD